MLIKNVIDPIRKAEVYEIEIGEISSLEDFQNKSTLCVDYPKYSPCGSLYRDWDKNRTFVFPFTMSLEKNFKENMINTLKNISDKKIDAYNINSFSKYYSARDTYLSSYDRTKDYQISLYSPNMKNKTTYIQKDVLTYWINEFNISKRDLDTYYFSNPSAKNNHDVTMGSCTNSKNYYSPLLLRLKGENNKTLANYEYSVFACKSKFNYPISIIEPYSIQYKDSYGNNEYMNTLRHSDAYDLILLAIDNGVFQPGDRMVEHELAKIFGFSRTPIREALHKLETQSLLMRVGRSLVVASLDHTQLSDPVSYTHLTLPTTPYV